MCEWPTRSRLPTGQSKDLLSNVPGAAGGEETQGRLPARRSTGPRVPPWQTPSSREQLGASGQWAESDWQELSRGRGSLFSGGREGFLEEGA